MALVEVENLTKIYGFPSKVFARVLGYDPALRLPNRRMVRAVDNLSVTVEEGEVFGLLGPNGSGKTTLVKLMLDIIRPTLGSIAIMGCKPGTKRVHRQIGYLPEQPYFYDRMNAVELLEFYGSIYRIDRATLHQRIQDAIDLVSLRGHERRNLRSYSKGMLQRIGLAQALISKPKIVFLDEPSTGLDPLGRKQVKNVISRLRDSGTTVFFNTHILSDVEDVADRVAIIHRGQLIRIGKVSEMTESIDKIVIRLRSIDDSYLALFDDIAESCDVVEGKLVLRFTDQDGIPRAIRRLTSAGADIFEVMHQRETLEDVFVREVTGNDQGQAAK